MKNKSPIYPIIGMLFSVVIIFYGMVMANSYTTLIVFGIILIIFICYGYFFTCLFWLPFSIIFCGIFAAITYAISNSIDEMVVGITRSLGICMAIIPGMGLSISYLTRSLETIKTPRHLTLGIMITYAFFPILLKEIRQIREAMKVRKASNLFNPKIFYRALFIPLIIQLINISDILSLSIETRGFNMYDKNYKPYKIITIKIKDIIFIALIITLIILGIVYQNILLGV